jgi:Tfp pilus assembly protein PilF
VKLRILLILGFVFFLAAVSPAADRAEWEGVERIVAIGDVHGAYNNLLAVLKSAGLINAELRWIGGKTHLVQTGDVVDRGADSRQCMDLLMRLEEEAQRAGGRVHVLIGNHDAFNVIGILDYVSAEEYASYMDESSEKRYEKEFNAYWERANKKVRAEGKIMPDEAEVRKVFDSKFPLGFFDHREAFGPEGRYGKWIRRRNVTVKLNGNVFSHGDWSEAHAALGIDEINRRVTDELTGKAPLESGIIFDVQGPLQNRWISKLPLDAEEGADKIERILTALKARRLVVGHTVTDGIIESRFGGRHISIDTGMLEVYQGGHQVALEIEGEALRAVHPLGKVPIPTTMDDDSLFNYLVGIAGVDKENVNVYSRLAGEFRARANLYAARDTLEQLFRIKKPVAFRFRKDLGDIYLELGQPEKAREQHLAYIEGLRSLIAVTPNNPHLKNLLARFCLDHNLEINVAEQMIQQALRDEPDNATFLLSLGRIQNLLRQFAAAAATLEKAVARGGGDYQTHYQLGLAYLGLAQNARARQAFERALVANPAGAEAREALRKLDSTGQNPGN